MEGFFLKGVCFVDFCLEVNNIIVWIEVLKKFGCLDYSLKFIKNKKLYYCFLSSFLNEIIEFCVLNVVIFRGKCIFIFFLIKFKF